MKNIHLIFTLENLNEIHASKDVIAIPSTLAKIRNLVPHIYGSCSPSLKKICPEFNISESAKIGYLKYIWRATASNKGQSIFIYFHPRAETFIQIILLKLISRSSRIFLKLDIDPNFFLYRPSLKARIVSTIALQFADIIAVEDIGMYEKILNKKIFGYDAKQKLIHLPNGTNERRMNESTKKNQIIVISRFNSDQKNTPLLFDLLNSAQSFKKYDILLFGPIEKNKEHFLKRVDELNNLINIKYMGIETNKKNLIKYLSESRAILSTSKYEGFALIFPEAVVCGAAIISTDVNGFYETSNHYKYGHLIDGDKPDQRVITKLNNFLEELLKKEELFFKEIEEHGKKNFTWASILTEDKVNRILGD